MIAFIQNHSTVLAMLSCVFAQEIQLGFNSVCGRKNNHALRSLLVNS